MKFVLTNDDGIDAVGIKVLQTVFANYGEVITIAPAEHLSGCSHQVSTHKMIKVSNDAENEFRVHGTPADCSRLAIAELCPDVDWIISGVNAGGNLGADIYISGTVAASREAAMHDVKSISFSQYLRHGIKIDYALIEKWVARVFEELQTRDIGHRAFWNVNFPHLDPETVDHDLATGTMLAFCSVDNNPLEVTFNRSEEGYTFAGNYHERPRWPGSDVDRCFSGDIAISKITI